MEVQDHAIRRPLEKSAVNWKKKGLLTKQSSSPNGKRVTFSLWVKTRCDQVLQKFRPSTNEENMSPEEWGSLIYTYVKDRGMTNGVYTFYELTEGSDTVGQSFFPFASLQFVLPHPSLSNLLLLDSSTSLPPPPHWRVPEKAGWPCVRSFSRS